MSVDVLQGSAALPADGFRRREGSPLFVPDDIAREREVWTWDDWKLLDRVTKLLASRGLAFFLQCDRCAARAKRDGTRLPPLDSVRRRDGGRTLRCQCKDREFIPKSQ